MTKEDKERTGIGIIIYVLIIIICAVITLMFTSCSNTNELNMTVYTDTMIEESSYQDFSIFDTLIIEQRISNCTYNYSRLYGIYNGNNLPKNDTTRTFKRNTYCLNIVQYNLFIPLK